MQEKRDPGSYKGAMENSVKILTQKDPVQIARWSGGMYRPDFSSLLLSSLGQLLQVELPQGEVYFKGTQQKPLWQWRLITTNYLGRAHGTPLAGNLISFRELEGGGTFLPAFQKSAIARLVKIAEENSIADINNACLQLGGELGSRGDAGALLHFYPRFPVTVVFWKGDEEIVSSANLLFDETANHYLHTEDIAVVGELVAYFLERLCRGDS